MKEGIPVVAHLCDGGPKEWGYQVRRRWQRKSDYFPAPSEKVARARLFAKMAANPALVQGRVIFAQKYYDPAPVLTIRVSHW